ncbi:MAG: hypothetical protein IJ200_00265 [Prevotella sp.]|nr:hypothetical protein [Prevotella sp.]
MKKRILGCLLTAVVATSSMAQVSSTVSPYSQYGLGVLAEQSQGFNRAMGGLSMGLRDGKLVNFQNPASYSAVDSLTMLFDMGLSGQITHYEEKGKKLNANTGNFDYGVGLFRLFPKIGVSFGIVPYSNIGYEYSSQQSVGNSADVVTETHQGSGGFSQAFVGIGWEFLKGFSVGANVSYFWGRYDKSVSLVSSDAYVNTQTKTYSSSVSSYKIDLGLQWQQALNKDNMLTVGAAVGIGHDLGAEATLVTATTSTDATLTPDTMRVDKAFSLPFTFGVGATLVHKQRLTVGLDYQLQKWGSLKYPMLNEATNRYENMSGLMNDRHKFVAGLDWIPDPNPMNRKFFRRIHYRLGASYATPYYNIQGADGPKEFSLSAGFGIPLVNSWGNRTVLNISAQWVHASASSLVTENSFRINIGLTFNERWFAKWKVD